MENARPAIFSDTLSATTRGEWDLYYRQMAPYLTSEIQEFRFFALERLCTAVMSAEGSSLRRKTKNGIIASESEPEWTEAEREARLTWLLGLIERARMENPDIGPEFLRVLRYKSCGDGSIVRGFLEAWRQAPPPSVPLDMIRGTIVLHTDEEAPWEQTFPLWIELLDDPSAYVRACAARMLGDRCNLFTVPSSRALFDLIGEKELLRPGIAGPFWSSACHWREGDIDAEAWMLHILENRAGPEPDNLPFNGIDFHLHEICDSSPAAVERMLRAGHRDLAMMTATEIRDAAPGMKDILIRLGHDADQQYAFQAWLHLARYHNVLHPAVTPDCLIHYLPAYVPGADTYLIGDPGMVLYPKPGAPSFTDAEAWAKIDHVLPESLRGPIGVSALAFDNQPGPCRVGNQLLHEYNDNAMIRLQGDPDSRLWRRIEIAARRNLSGKWFRRR